MRPKLPSYKTAGLGLKQFILRWHVNFCQYTEKIWKRSYLSNLDVMNHVDIILPTQYCTLEKYGKYEDI